MRAELLTINYLGRRTTLHTVPGLHTYSIHHQIHIKFYTNFAISSSAALLNITVSVLNKEFEVPPYSQSVELGSQVEMRCHPPLGKPEPKVGQPARPVIFIAEDVLDLLDEEQGRDRSREG